MKNSKIYPWVVVGLLWGVALLNYMDRQMLSTMRDAMAVDITELQSAANFGRLMGVFLWIYGCMSPIAGMVGDRMNRKWLIVGSLFVWSAVTYLMGIADTYNEVFFLRALMGISEALYIPAGLSLIADYHSDKSRSLAIGIHMTGLYTGQAIGGFGATVAAAFSWHTTPSVSFAHPITHTRLDCEVFKLAVIPKTERIVLYGKMGGPMRGKSHGTLHIQIPRT